MSPLKQCGFTLVELIAVIVLLGVIGAATTSFITSSAQIYNDTARRDNLSQMGRFAVERVSREVRNALPGSVRVETVTNSGVTTQCLEFMPISAASNYLGRVSDAPPISSIAVVDFGYVFTANDRVAIYTIENDDVYAPGSQALASVASVVAGAVDQQNISLTASNRFPDESPTERIYIVNQRVSFCADSSNNTLRRYAGYPAAGLAQPVPPTGGILLAEAIQFQSRVGTAVNVFDFSPGTLQRAGIVHLNFIFRDNVVTDEWVEFSQDVAVRNVP